MYSPQKARLHLSLIAACLLTANLLPTLNKLWFVSESGNYSGSPLLTALVLAGMFNRWRPARALLAALSGLHFMLLYFMVHSGGLASVRPGFYATGALHLLALGILCFSPDLNRYMHDAPARPAAR
ncbi:hypothetical protein F0P96_10910 [Hymenobacter busanensis]|uniref:Uncharacterized protein n=1 Tax=Hymenobacter busanensis TaxID=2607656 RepID=A0A7L4ZXT5_9BACT|nr:hypothetical protein [Hymenobacter busanensis]KAA9333470.1 hypothetical protein F0P96_10910 [Hymenobacter busanensis]QHJ07847.1 hypothetical protein GUY19_11375 [Hymenobacter busanensis]